MAGPSRNTTTEVNLREIESPVPVQMFVSQGNGILTNYGAHDTAALRALIDSVVQKLERNPETPRLTERERNFAVSRLLACQAAALGNLVNAPEEEVPVLATLAKVLSAFGWHSDGTTTACSGAPGTGAH